MMTGRVQVTCPECAEANHYDIEKLELVDTDLHVTYRCACGCYFTNVHALVYLGGYTDTIMYDRDNVITER